MASRQARSTLAVLLLFAAPPRAQIFDAYRPVRATLAMVDWAERTGHFTAAAHTANAPGQVQRYRQILVGAMESEGFRNYDQEWWHFSYPLDGAVPFDRVIR